MATAPQITEWDEKGNPVPQSAAGSATEWDEHGNPVHAPGFMDRLKAAVTPDDKPVWDSGENPQLGNPTGTLPIGKEMATAGTLAGAVAGLGEGNMGMPSPAKIVPSGAWSKLGEYGRKILGIENPDQGSPAWASQQAAPLNRQLPPHREPIAMPAAPDRSGPIPADERIQMPGWAQREGPQPAKPLSASRQLPPHKEPIITPPPADRSGPIPPEERIDLGRGGYPEPKPEAPPQTKPLTGSTGQQVDQLVNQAYGVKPLEKNVPIRSQIETKGYGAQYSAPTGQVPATETARPATQGLAKPLTPTAAANAPETPPKAQHMSLAEKYPDKAVRQMVHANGEKLVNAVGDDPETMQVLHSLTAVDLRQALINAGEDMGQRTITSSKFAGPGAITRQQAFEKLLEKGHSPQDIVRLAKAGAESKTR